MSIPKITPVQESAMIEACTYGVVQDNVKAVTVKSLLSKGLITLVASDDEGSYVPTDLGYKSVGLRPPVSVELARVEESVSADEAGFSDEPLADWERELLYAAPEDTSSVLAEFERELLESTPEEVSSVAIDEDDLFVLSPNRADRRKARRVERAHNRHNAKVMGQRMKRWGSRNVIVGVRDAA